MISSPCKTCPKINLPKDQCLRTCRMIQDIQGEQLIRKESSIYSAVDFSEENRFQVISLFGQDC